MVGCRCHRSSAGADWWTCLTYQVGVNSPVDYRHIRNQRVQIHLNVGPADVVPGLPVAQTMHSCLELGRTGELKHGSKEKPGRHPSA
jgi:hypothetical protein